MQLKQNSFKQALKAGKPIYGLWLGLPHSSCAEIAAGAGFDWLLIDMEHAPYSLMDVQHHLQAIAPYNTSALVRPVEGRTAVIKQLLDIGVQTLLVPMVETAEQAEELVQDVRYPPQGRRGLGTSMARGAHWNGIGDYLHTANDEICLIVQVESTTAVENIDAIANVDGVDAVFIGPSDLSASMGYIGEHGNPAVIEAIEGCIKSVRAAGKAAGVLAVDAELVKHYVAHGVTFVGVGADSGLLASSVRNLAASFKSDKTEEHKAGY
ncbi:MAG: aldolase/citrate lyase family protein [Pseudomonadales bacterium]